MTMKKTVELLCCFLHESVIEWVEVNSPHCVWNGKSAVRFLCCKHVVFAVGLSVWGGGEWVFLPWVPSASLLQPLWQWSPECSPDRCREETKGKRGVVSTDVHKQTRRNTNKQSLNANWQTLLHSHAYLSLSSLYPFFCLFFKSVRLSECSRWTRVRSQKQSHGRSTIHAFIGMAIC